VKAESLVISVVIQAAFSHIFEVILIIATALILKVSLLAFLAYPLIFFLFFIITLGISFIFATIGVYISDLNNIWSILSQILFLISPIFYLPSENGLIAKFNLINPIAYFLEVLRSALIYGEIKIIPLLIIFGLGIFSLSFGILIFQKHKTKFAELL
jgi:lipopolysaccharide transport system permease protein